MIDKDSLTSRIMGRICERKASLMSKMIVRAAVRTAIDLACSGSDVAEDELELENEVVDLLGVAARHLPW
jgi:hypothetical protein